MANDKETSSQKSVDNSQEIVGKFKWQTKAKIQ
jgi:hypothetical protein